MSSKPGESMFAKKIFAIAGLCLISMSSTVCSDDFVTEKASAAVATVNQSDFDLFIKSDVTLVDFYADWCGPCKKLAPLFRELAREYEGKVKFGKINIDYAKSVAEKKSVKQIPTMILFKDGQELKRRGPGSKAEIAAWIDSAL